ncbi:hypothetical protein QA648_10960 [Rhizobium sp. CB3171]|uniref:hypothetical protein n=1 Tax=Rhizobium sp. CB3171 TaxID=3039157 RepID=UPI0024B21A6A|nr:hypothetical protein [Rhizobium sp. CB3171]WFU00691.1 hypothetical protein QA648_10960 [Rhizobium sp. CB3171]
MNLKNLSAICFYSSALLAASHANAEFNLVPPLGPPPPGLSVIPVPGSNTQAAAISNTDDIVVIATRINPERAAKNLGTVLRECTGNEICNGALDAALAEFGIPEGSAKMAMDFIPNVTQGGENTFYDLQLPSGYSFCHMKMDFYSAVPASGDRASFIDMNLTAALVRINTWTPVRGLGEGRSWVDAFITVEGVRNDVADQWYSSGKCTMARNERLTCRGDFNSSQVNHGQPGCRDITF